MRIARRTFLHAGVVLTAAAVSGCTEPRDSGPTTTPGVPTAPLRLGVAEYRPYAYKGEDGLTGQVVEVAEAVFARLAGEVEIRLVPYTALREGMSTGELDVVGALRLTEANCAWAVHFVPDHLSNTALAVPAGNPLGLNTFADVVARNARLAVVADSFEVDDARANGVTRLDVVPTAEVALATLAEGRVDCVAYDDITLRHLTARRPELSVGRSFEPAGGAPVYGFGFASEHGALAKSFADALATLRENGEWLRVADPFGFTEKNSLPTASADRKCER